MKLYIFTKGDRSVGIQPTEFTISSNLSIEDDREEIRQHFITAISEIADEPITLAVFDDECPDCTTILKDNKCHNEKCINNENPT